MQKHARGEKFPRFCFCLWAAVYYLWHKHVYSLRKRKEFTRMHKQESVHNGEARGFDIGRELTEDELAGVFGGVGSNPSTPNTNAGNANSLGNLAGLGQLSNELTGQLTNELGGLLGTAPQTGSNQDNASQNLVPNLSSLPGMAPLQNLLGGLGL
jgi:hypothetical protein